MSEKSLKIKTQEEATAGDCELRGSRSFSI